MGQGRWLLDKGLVVPIVAALIGRNALSARQTKREREKGGKEGRKKGHMERQTTHAHAHAHAHVRAHAHGQLPTLHLRRRAGPPRRLGPDALPPHDVLPTVAALGAHGALIAVD